MSHKAPQLIMGREKREDAEEAEESQSCILPNIHTQHFVPNMYTRVTQHTYTTFNGFNHQTFKKGRDLDT
jgi:hypothetical protein